MTEYNCNYYRHNDVEGICSSDPSMEYEVIQGGVASSSELRTRLDLPVAPEDQRYLDVRKTSINLDTESIGEEKPKADDQNNGPEEFKKGDRSLKNASVVTLGIFLDPGYEFKIPNKTQSK